VCEYERKTEEQKDYMKRNKKRESKTAALDLEKYTSDGEKSRPSMI